MQSYWCLTIILFFINALNEGNSDSTCFCKEHSEKEVISNSNQNEGTTAVDKNTILPFKRMLGLQLQCNVDVLSPTLFSNPQTLLQLDVSQNKIARIKNEVFQSFTQLEMLNMSHNILRNPAKDTFEPLLNLKVLDLSFNKISNIQYTLLDTLKKLEKLYVNNNGLFDLVPEIFEELTNINEINVSNNHIRSIDHKLFKHLTLLEILNLSNNELYDDDILIDTFSTLAKLKRLCLSNINLKLLDGLFDNNINLIDLDLSKNKILKLPQGIFHRLKHLKLLNLSFCQLLTLPETLLLQQTELQDLDLSHNYLRIIPVNLFQTAQTLQTLNLSHNLIRNLSGSILGNTKVNLLDLGFNQLTEVSPQLLNVPTLLNVYLQNNKLTSINELSQFSFTLNAKYLNLQFNQLVFIKTDIFKVMPHLNKLEIFGNPWNCKCLDEFLTVLFSKGINYTTEHYYQGTSPVCVTSHSCKYEETNISYYYDIFMRN